MNDSTNQPVIPVTDPVAFSIIDDMDTAIAVLYIGRDHGITPQADGCLRDVTVRCRDYLGDRRKVFGKEWAEARSSWIRPGPEVAPLAAALSEALNLIDALTGDDRKAADRVRAKLRRELPTLHHLRALLVKAEG